jgi:hypothetical protein
MIIQDIDGFKTELIDKNKGGRSNWIDINPGLRKVIVLPCADFAGPFLPC